MRKTGNKPAYCKLGQSPPPFFPQSTAQHIPHILYPKRYVIFPTIIWTTITCHSNNLSYTLYVLNGGENFICPTPHLSHTSFVLHLICPTHNLSYTPFVLHIISPTLHFSYISIILYYLIFFDFHTFVTKAFFIPLQL